MYTESDKMADMELFLKVGNAFQSLTVFAGSPVLRCLIEFQIPSFSIFKVFSNYKILITFSIRNMF